MRTLSTLSPQCIIRGMRWNFTSYYRLMQFLSKARVRAFLCTLRFIYDYIICDGDNVL